MHPHSSSWPLAAYVAEEAAHRDIEYEFFDNGGLSWVRRWIPSWAGFAWWFIVPDRGWEGPLTRAQWDLLRGGLDDDRWWWRRSAASRGTRLTSSHHASVHGCFWKNSGLHARAVRICKSGAIFRRGLVSDCHLFSAWVLPCGVQKIGFFW